VFEGYAIFGAPELGDRLERDVEPQRDAETQDEHDAGEDGDPLRPRGQAAAEPLGEFEGVFDAALAVRGGDEALGECEKINPNCAEV
jgi:hypothetical protein